VCFVLSLPPGKNPFAVKINNNKIIMSLYIKEQILILTKCPLEVEQSLLFIMAQLL
jgi:hypothetical protein